MLLKSMNDNNNRLSNRQRRCRWYRNLEIVCICFFEDVLFFAPMLVGSCQQKVTVKKMARIRQKIRSNICDVKQKTNSKERIHAGSYTHSRGNPVSVAQNTENVIENEDTNDIKNEAYVIIVPPDLVFRCFFFFMISLSYAADQFAYTYIRELHHKSSLNDKCIKWSKS